MAAPDGHGYIDFCDGKERFWRIETLWKAAEREAVIEQPLDGLPWRDDGCFILGDAPTWGAFADHCRRVADSELRYPIILSPDGEVMDGMHRIVRATLEGRKTLPAVRLKAYPAPDRTRELSQADPESK